MIAIYVRQSVDKRDSISIESQIASCLKEFEDQPYRIYNDKGFSGKNTDRPQFRQMIEDIRSGEISEVYVYKIDRISRAIVDFGKIMELFDRYHVEFISHTEKFDTSTPIGKAMLNIIMVFAQLERETIQQRITDNYYSRGEKGFYLGGYAPFGYDKAEMQKDGKKTSRYEIQEHEAAVVREIYERYGYGGESIGAIVRELNARGILTRKKRQWSPSAVSRILHSPVYVRADADIYEYLSGKNAHMNNPVQDYTGVNGCCVYGNARQRKPSVKFHAYDTDYVTIGAHEGMISSALWLTVQRRFEGKLRHSNGGTGESSWLQGLVRCRHCGYSCYVKQYQSGGGRKRYFYCRGKKNGTCRASGTMMRADKLEEIAEEEICRRLAAFPDTAVAQEENPEINLFKIRIAETEQKIQRLIHTLSSAQTVSMQYINAEIDRLDQEKREAEQAVHTLMTQQTCRGSGIFDAAGMIRQWKSYDITVKKEIASILLDHIEIDGCEVDIY